MARKIIVLGSEDRPTGEHLKRSVAQLAVRRGFADWIKKNVSIRRRTIAEIPPIVLFAKQPARCRVSRPYIPAKMPPREVNGTYFVPPRSTAWLLAHRTVILPAREAAAPSM